MNKDNNVSTVVKAVLETQSQNAEKKANLNICDVCGHNNEPSQTICVMCSNYLIKE